MAYSLCCLMPKYKFLTLLDLGYYAVRYPLDTCLHDYPVFPRKTMNRIVLRLLETVSQVLFKNGMYAPNKMWYFLNSFIVFKTIKI